MLPLALVLVMAIPAAAQPAVTPPPDPVAHVLSGRWTGTGTILGQPARVELEWTPVLAGRFARLTWTSEIGAAPKTQRFEGHAYYPRWPGARATWFDSGGMVRPIEVALVDGAVVATWGSRETELGDTTYRRIGTDRLEVVDRVLGKTGEWREFGRSMLTRVP